MKGLHLVLLILLAAKVPAFATVAVSSPASGSTVTSPVHYVATATSPTCSKGIGSMGIYVNNKLTYVVDAKQLDTEITLATGAQHTVVEAWDKCGGGANTTVDLTVAAVAKPAVTITANPIAIAAGGSSILKVTAKNATLVTIKGSDDSSHTLGVTGGVQSVSPIATTTYTVTATGAGGKASAAVTVTVDPAPTVGITANPASIAAGGSSTLKVTAKNSTQVTMKGSDGSAYTFGDTGGTKTVKPTMTTTYTVSATGVGGKTSAATTVTVSPAPTVSISANPNSVAAGTSSTLTVNASHATQVTISGSNSTSYTLPAAGGIQSISPTATTTYTVSAAGAGGKATAKATVTVIPAPAVSISASPSSVAAGGSSNLTVKAANATSVTVSGSDSTSYSLGPAGGSLPVSPTATTTYTAAATGPGGNASASTTVSLIPAPTVTISANPTSIATGSSSTLTVNAANATSVTEIGTDGSSHTFSPAGGSQLVKPTANTTYTVTAIGKGGNASAAATVTVGPAPTVTIAANPTSIAPGSSSLLAVTATNATQVVITGTDSSLYTLGATGGTQSVSPSAPTTYTATATGAGGRISAAVHIAVQGVASSLTNLQASAGWESYGQLPPKYADCSPCSGIKWSMTPGITSPSQSGNATEFSTSGTKPYAVVLWVNPVLGQYSTQGLPDKTQTLVPTLHNFTYDADIYVTNVAITEALEFDVAMYLNGPAMFWGTQCAPLGDGDWDVLNNTTKHWVSTGIPCELVNGWNHLTLQFQRQPDNTLLYNSVTLNGVTNSINMSYAPYTVPSSWYGVTLNYQMDGNKTQASNATYLDNLTLTYW